MISCSRSIAPTASAHSAAVAASTARSISGSAAPSAAEQGVGTHARRIEADVGGALVVLRAIAAARDAGRARVDEKQRHAVAVARVAVRAGRDDQQVGAVAGEHEALRAVESRQPSPSRSARVVTSARS